MQLKDSVTHTLSILFLSSILHVESQEYQQTQRALIEYGGVQIGNDLDLASGGSCFIGTLGGFVNDGQLNYILSNNHVMAREGSAIIGEDIMHAYSRNCFVGANPIHIGELAGFVGIRFKGRKSQNFVDLAIARPVIGSSFPVTDENGQSMNIDNDGPGGVADEFFVANNPLTTPSLNLAVKKSGRTTGLTRGEILIIGTTIRVGYNGGTATFYDQIGIQSSAGSFSLGGDSGSLIVTESDNRPVGLLFAGSDTWTFANPIGRVITALQDLGLSEVNFGTVESDIGVNPGDLDDTDGGNGAGNGGGNGGGKGKKPRGAAASKGVQKALDLLKNKRAELLALDQAIGVGVGVSKSDSRTSIVLFVKKITPGLIRKIPSNLDGIPVEVEESGEIIAF